ncbi:MAG: APC family permease, partial [Rhodothermales bacterium]
VYNALFTIGLLWFVILLNIVGLERGKWIQNVGAMSTWAVFIVLAVVGLIVWVEHGSATTFTVETMMPDFSRLPTITFFATMTFAFAGLELAPIMAGEIKDPRRSIPRAIWLSGIMIAVIYIAGTAFLMVSLPDKEIGVISGIPQAFVSLAERLDFGALGFVGALLVVVASSGGLGAWVAGAARMPFVVGIDRYLPESLGRVHPKWGTPYVALVTQGVVATLLIVAAVAGSTVEEAYVVLLDMTIILYFIPFLYLFAILPFVRKRKVGDDGDVLRVPGGMTAVWIVALLGFGATLLSIVLATIPPEGSESPGIFFSKTIGGTILFLVVGLAFYYHGRRKS